MAKSKATASDHEGHTHPWPIKLPKSGDLTCDVCVLIVPAALVHDDRLAIVNQVTG